MARIKKLIIFCCLIPTAISVSCSLFRGDRQPAVSEDAYTLEKFSDETPFPYVASTERTSEISKRYPEIEIGMNGDDVLKIMGNPDEVTALHFVGEPVHHWTWSYFLNREYRRAPDDSDNYVEIYFDKQGRVEQVLSRFDAPPKPTAPSKPTPLPANMAIKVANAPDKSERNPPE